MCSGVEAKGKVLESHSSQFTVLVCLFENPPGVQHLMHYAKER